MKIAYREPTVFGQRSVNRVPESVDNELKGRYTSKCGFRTASHGRGGDRGADRGQRPQ